LGGFVGQARGVRGKKGAAQIGDPERIPQIRADGAREGVSAFVDQTGIGAVEQHGANFLIRPLQKYGNPRCRYLHCISLTPASRFSRPCGVA
jgi:hypothetical protein